MQRILCLYFAVAKELASSRVQVVSAFAAQVGLLIGRKKAGDEVRTLNHDMERRVAERTEELLEANRELEAFTYTVSPDLMFDDMLDVLYIIEIFCEVEIVRGEPPAIHGDRLLIRQAFFHLLSNAFKFTRKRLDARIAITGERHPGSVVISISDNGTVFDMKYANRLFGIFHRLHSEDGFEGTGVGLSIVHRRGGHIRFQATEGEWATFPVMLPVHGEPV